MISFKMKKRMKKEKTTQERVPKYNHKLGQSQRGKSDTSKTRMHDCSLSWLGLYRIVLIYGSRDRGRSP